MSVPGSPLLYEEKNYSFPVDAVLLLGPTGAGKSPLGECISRNGLFGKKAHHLDFGAELRIIIARSDSSLLYSSLEIAFITGLLKHGLLLENQHFSIAKKIIGLFLERSGFSSSDVLVLNGIPRHIGQANDIVSIAAIRALVVLDCSVDSVFCRLRDNVAGDRTGRFDDDLALVDSKLRLYKERTMPLVDYYMHTGAVIIPVPINTATTADEAYRRISLPSSGYPPVAFVAEPPE